MKRDNVDLLKEIGFRMRRCREDNCYSREMAAELLGMTARTLAAYERGEREITMNTIIKMAEIYRTTVGKLIDYDYAIKIVQ